MRVFYTIVLLFGLLGCAGESAIYADSIRAIVKSQSADVTLDKPLNPSYRYLRVTQNDRPLLMVLGYVESDAATGAVTDVWYSSQSEVLKIKAGRIVAMTGTPFDWAEVRHMGAPDWARVLNEAQPPTYHYTRERDVAAGYRYGVREKVSLQKIAKPVHSALAGFERPDLIWFKESIEPNHLPDSIYALAPSASGGGVPQVVYSWQCLAVDFCFSMQAWSPQDHAAMVAKAGR
jgi:hypothetical protein